MPIGKWATSVLHWFGKALTGVKVSRFPREQIIEALDQTIAHSQSGFYQAGVIVAQVDNFARLEEIYGGTATAAAMQAIEDRLMDGPCSRDVVRRMGEGKFTVVPTPMTQVSPKLLRELSKSLQSLVSQPLSINDNRTYLTISVGYAAQSQLENPNGSLLLDAAQAALRAAHRSGPASCQAYDAELQAFLATRDARTREIRTALRSGDIHAYFQPQVAITTGEVIGFEALARWRHPERGMISPGEFIPQMEQLGLMPELSFTMLSNALRSLRSWREEGFAIPAISVNFSTEELRNPNLPDFVAFEIEKNNLSPNQLVIEVLETVVADHGSQEILHNLKTLSDMGCHLDLDDFGTGNASITTIRTFGVDRIKIDRSFVSNGHADPDKQAMVEAIIAISEKLSVDTLAEGAETKAELDFLQKVNCPSVQGYVIAPPMPCSEVIGWLQQWTNRAANTALRAAI